MNNRAIDLAQAIPEHHLSPKISQPCEGALDFLSAPVPTQLSAVFQTGPSPIETMRADQNDPLYHQQLQRLTSEIKKGAGENEKGNNAFSIYFIHEFLSSVCQ